MRCCRFTLSEKLYLFTSLSLYLRLATAATQNLITNKDVKYDCKQSSSPQRRSRSHEAHYPLPQLFDKWAKAFLGDNGRYGRYADDWVAVHKDKERLLSMLPEARKFLKENLNLTLHPDKIYLQEAKKGVKFCGAVVKQKRLYISNTTLKSVYYAVDRYNSGQQDLQSFCQTINSLLGLLGHFATYAIRWEIWISIQDKNGLCSHRMQKILPARRSSSRTPSYCVKETQTSSQQNL